jgi:hypothetical protein
MTEVREGTTGAATGSTDVAEAQAADTAKNRFAALVDTRSTQAGEQLRSTAGDVRSVGTKLRSQGRDKPAELADRAAGRVERIGGYLHDSDADRIIRDVEGFGRRNPWPVAAGALALGVAAARALKASGSGR